MAAYEHVLIDVDAGIGTVTLNRPERLNAFDRAMCQDLLEALQMLANADAVLVMVLTGAGRGFTTGADLNALGADGPALVAAGRDIILAIRNAPKPVIASVNGPAAGGGANLALACDYRIASDRASIGQVFHRLSLVPDWGGSFFLPRLVGTGKALELIWSARMLEAQEAMSLGVFDRIVPHEQLAAETRVLAAQWAAQPPAAVRRAKQAVYHTESSALQASLDLEILQQNELFATAETRQRIAAALAKRS